MALIPIEHKNVRILTTQQLASYYEASTDKIKKNFRNNRQKYQMNKHFFYLEGTELADFKMQGKNLDLVNPKSSHLYLWTEHGALLHAKSLGTDKAWEVYERLIDTYFRAHEFQASLQSLSPQLQLLINLEIEQKRQAAVIEQTSQQLNDIRDIVALNPTQWRSDSTKLINRIAEKRGGSEFIKPTRNEIYSLLEQRYGVDLGNRLTRKKRRMVDEGVCRTKRDKANHLDVIADDKKLIEGYISIVKETAIKYGIT